MNLLAEYPGPARSGKGDAFPRSRAAAGARRLAPSLAGRRAVLLGRAVAGAFRLPGDVPFLTWVEAEVRGVRISVAVVPHPSGVNTWWNDAGNRRCARRFLRGALGVRHRRRARRA